MKTLFIIDFPIDYDSKISNHREKDDEGRTCLSRK